MVPILLNDLHGDPSLSATRSFWMAPFFLYWVQTKHIVLWHHISFFYHRFPRRIKLIMPTDYPLSQSPYISLSWFYIPSIVRSKQEWKLIPSIGACSIERQEEEKGEATNASKFIAGDKSIGAEESWWPFILEGEVLRSDIVIFMPLESVCEKLIALSPRRKIIWECKNKRMHEHF